MELSDRVALIPGASRPIGRAIANIFGRNGATLILPFYKDWPDSTVEMKRHFNRAGYDFLSIECDLTREDETETLLAQVESNYGVLHYLINNIERGGMPVVHGSYELEINQDQWDLEFNTTLKAKWNLFNNSLRLLKKSNRGAVINISSIAGLTGRSGPVAPLFNDGYSAANCGISSFTRQWAKEAAPEIRVNEIMLGLFKTRHGEETRGWSLLSSEQKEAIINRTLMARTGNPEEVAELAYFLAAKAGYMSGSTIVLDGGYLVGAEDVKPIGEGILG